jgi:polar amino acid transport system substrate-binding protein
MRHPYTLAATAIVVASALSACGGATGDVSADCKPAHDFSAVRKGMLTVSTFDLPPFTKVKGTKLSGVDGDILKEIAKRECLTITVMPLDASAVIPAVDAGRADVAAGDWYRTAKRAEAVALSAPLYLDQMGIISSDKVNTVTGFDGKTVGTVDGYLWVEDLQKYLGHGLVTYPSSTAMWQDLKAGRIDVAVDSYASAVYANDSIGGGKYSVEVAQPDPAVAASKEPAQAGFPIPKDNKGLLKAIDADIEAMQEDGTIADILQKNGLDASAADTGKPRLIK